jgi:hypothetical protein
VISVQRPPDRLLCFDCGSRITGFPPQADIFPAELLANLSQLRIVTPPGPRIRGANFGLWLSLVERLVRVEEVESSNLSSPTMFSVTPVTLLLANFWRMNLPFQFPSY